MSEKREREGELLKGNTPTLLLATLREQPRHGYALAQEIKRRSADALSLGEGSLYPALKALERDGFIEGRWEEQPSGSSRKVYFLTDAGRGELERRTRAWRSFSHAIESVLTGGNPDAQPS